MPVKNLTRNSILASRSRLADSAMKRIVGLMFSRQTKSAMILKFGRETKVSLHTFFVFFPIDIVFVDGNSTVAELVENMQPFTTYTAKEKAKCVVELPAGMIRASRTKVGDKIAFLQVVERKLENGRRVTVTQTPGV
ncbi:DUF192 domain-containing protein [Candidatus Woesearchaeota archaeon]|nr:DUF192 domain-containing protein [Candidatus Woesearchaeota archaeon]